MLTSGDFDTNFTPRRGDAAGRAMRCDAPTPMLRAHGREAIEAAMPSIAILSPSRGGRY
jgi:hypothetical protein